MIDVSDADSMGRCSFEFVAVRNCAGRASFGFVNTLSRNLLGPAFRSVLVIWLAVSESLGVAKMIY